MNGLFPQLLILCRKAKVGRSGCLEFLIDYKYFRTFKIFKNYIGFLLLFFRVTAKCLHIILVVLVFTVVGAGPPAFGPFFLFCYRIFPLSQMSGLVFKDRSVRIATSSLTSPAGDFLRCRQKFEPSYEIWVPGIFTLDLAVVL